MGATTSSQWNVALSSFADVRSWRRGAFFWRPFNKIVINLVAHLTDMVNSCKNPYLMCISFLFRLSTRTLADGWSLRSFSRPGHSIVRLATCSLCIEFAYSIWLSIWRPRFAGRCFAYSTCWPYLLISQEKHHSDPVLHHSVAWDDSCTPTHL